MAKGNPTVPIVLLRGGKVWHLPISCDSTGAFKTLCGHSHRRRDAWLIEGGRLSEVTCMQCRRRIGVWKVQIKRKGVPQCLTDSTGSH
jgi:hypothetical protein